MSRRLAREAVLKALFAVDLGRIPVQGVLQNVLAELDLSERDRAFAEQLATGTLANKEASDRIIANQAIGWAVERMATIDRNILRLALYEIYHRDDIPDSVSVNEAVELAKRYGEDDSGKFINGILGEIVRNRPVQKE